MKIRPYQDTSGDPCYQVDGHVDVEEFRAQLAKMSDYGEDEESAGDYQITQCWVVRFIDDDWNVVVRMPRMLNR